MRDAFPRDLAVYVKREWGKSRTLPALKHVETLLSTCYHSSLLREETRPIRFRLLLCDPDSLPASEGPPRGLHRLIFVKPRRFNSNELRRLSPATDYHRALIGVHLNADQRWEIWGIVHSGILWTEANNGGAKDPPDLPQVPVLQVSGPSELTMSRGSEIVATLQGGRLSKPSADVLDSDWLTRLFAEMRTEVMQLHLSARDSAKATSWATMHDDFANDLFRGFMKRLIRAMRDTSNGSSILFVPNDRAEEFSLDNKFFNFKYRFTAVAPRRRFITLVVQILNGLAGLHIGSEQPVGWSEYVVAAKKGQLQDLDEALSELAYLIASLTAIDGAVIVSRNFEVLGFGAEITELSDVKRVARALDAEGEKVKLEATESQGMRHRSVYRLCNAVTSITGLVISHDGELRFVKHREGRVTYWNQLAHAAMDL
ncbi:MAG: hypothetical protein ACI957_002029 [Verrucomicrobiales bacterium]|jgi:hypothetical protein